MQWYDVSSLAIFAVCMLVGYSRGLIRTVLGFCRSLIALGLGLFISQRYYATFSAAVVQPVIRKTIEKQLEAQSSAVASDLTNQLSAQTDSIGQFFSQAGQNLAQSFGRIFSGVGENVTSAVYGSLSDSISRLILFVLAFALCSVILGWVILLLDVVFKLPLLSQVNHLGGIFAGVVVAVALCVVGSFALFSWAKLYGPGDTLPSALQALFDSKIALRFYEYVTPFF